MYCGQKLFTIIFVSARLIQTGLLNQTTVFGFLKLFFFVELIESNCKLISTNLRFLLTSGTTGTWKVRPVWKIDMSTIRIFIFWEKNVTVVIAIAIIPTKLHKTVTFDTMLTLVLFKASVRDNARSEPICLSCSTHV